MANVTKGDILFMALRKAGIASAATLQQPDPDSIMDGLEDLEAMIAQWRSTGFDIGYNISEDGKPLPDDDSGLPIDYKLPVALQLSRQILIDNQRDIPDELATQAHNAMIQLRSAFFEPKYLQRRNDMLTGAGNNKSAEWNRFYHQNTTEEGGGA